MKHLHLSEDEFSSSEDDSTTPPPTKKTKTIDNRLPLRTNNVKGANAFPSRAAVSSGCKFVQSDLIGNYWACLISPVPVVTTPAPHITGDRENALLRQQLEVDQQEMLALKQQLQQQ